MLSDLGNMFENFRAGYAIECIVGKVELRHVTGKQWQCPDNRRKGFSRSSAVTEAKCSVSSLERKLFCDIECRVMALGQNAE
jgi:hypothetical protein